MVRNADAFLRVADSYVDMDEVFTPIVDYGLQSIVACTASLHADSYPSRWKVHLVAYDNQPVLGRKKIGHSHT